MHIPQAPGMQAAIDRHFEGDRALYDDFATACLAQFALDAHAGEAACATADFPVLRRISHDLKTVLGLLGFAGLGGLAGDTEHHAAARDLSASTRSWRSLHSQLLALRASSVSSHGSSR